MGDSQEADKNNRSECYVEGQVMGAGDKRPEESLQHRVEGEGQPKT